MKFDLPVERKLPDKEAHLEEIFGGGHEGRTRPRRPGPSTSHPGPRGRRFGLVAPLAAAVAAAALVGTGIGVAALVDRGNDGRGDDSVVASGGDATTGSSDGAQPSDGLAPNARTQPNARARSQGKAEVNLAVANLDVERAAELGTECAAGIGSGQASFGPDEVLSAQVQRNLGGKGRLAVIIAEDTATGERVGCAVWLRGRAASIDSASLMGGPGSKSTVNQTDATHPAIPTDGPGGYASDDDRLVVSATYEVDDRVELMRSRYVIDGEPGPWFVAAAASGWVHVQAALEVHAIDDAQKVVLETEVLDASGQRLHAPGDQVGGGGISKSPGKTRRDDVADLLCMGGHGSAPICG